jgi:hypothetical protein
MTCNECYRHDELFPDIIPVTGRKRPKTINCEEEAMSKDLKEYFNKMPRLGALATAGKDGKVDVAYFGSAQMIDEKTIFMGCGKNRTFAYLQENPYAVFAIMEAGQTPSEWKGVRVYLKMAECQTSGEKRDSLKAQLRAMAGEAAANMMHAAITFEVQEVRPFADFGQGWEKSI